MRRRLKRGLAGALLLSTFPIAFVFAGAIHHHRGTVCLYRSLIGLDCPFCGLTRAFASATHGAFEEAFAFNAFWPGAAALFFGGGLYLLATALCRSQPPDPQRGGRLETLILWLSLGLILTALLFG